MDYRIQENNSIKYSGSSPTTLLISIMGGLVFPGLAIYLIIDMIPFGRETSDILGVIFLFAWAGLAIWIGLNAFDSYIESMEINNQGIFYRSLKKRQHLFWSDVKDWGLSYHDSTEEDGLIFAFYFSSQPLAISDNGMKKEDIRLAEIMVTAYDSDKRQFLKEIIPYCQRRTGVMPFISPLFINRSAEYD